MATTLSIVLPDELAMRLEEAGIRDEEASCCAVAALTEVADRAEVRAWWNGLTAGQQSGEAAKTRASLAVADADCVSPATDVYARIRGRSEPAAGEGYIRPRTESRFDAKVAGAR